MKGAPQTGNKLPTKNSTQDLDGQEERIAWVYPMRPVWREPADGNHAVHVRMVQQILAPGVEHAQTPNRRAEMFRVDRDLEQRGRARAEEQVVDHLLVLEREPRELVRQREDDVVVADRQQFLLPRREPLVAGAGQALRTVPIPTRVVRNGAMITARAAIEMAAQCRRAATRQSAEHAPVLGLRLRRFLSKVSSLEFPRGAEVAARRRVSRE